MLILDKYALEVNPNSLW